MEREPAKIDKVSIERDTYYASEYVRMTCERAKKMTDDAERTYRLKVSECVYCHAKEVRPMRNYHFQWQYVHRRALHSVRRGEWIVQALWG